MPVSELEPIEISCDHCGHTWETRAAYGSAGHCPACGKTRRIRLADRPREPVGLADAEAWPDGSESDSEPEPTDYDCPVCSEPLYWTRERTAYECLACEYWHVAAETVSRADNAELARLRDAQRAGNLAANAATSRPSVADRINQTSFIAARNKQIAVLNSLKRECDLNTLPDTWHAVAINKACEIDALTHVMSQMQDQAELNSYLTAMSDSLKNLQLDIRSLSHQRRLYINELEQDELEQDEPLAISNYEPEPEPEPELAFRPDGYRKPQNSLPGTIWGEPARAAITAGSTRRPMPTTYIGMATYGLSYLYAQSEQSKKERERKLAEYGTCGYSQNHKKPEIATRRYWITTLDWRGNQTGHTFQGAPQTGACKKHYAQAETWIEEQTALLISGGNRQILAVHTELT